MMVGHLDYATVSPAVNTTSVHESVLRSTPVASAGEFGTFLQHQPRPQSFDIKGAITSKIKLQVLTVRRHWLQAKTKC